MFSNNILRIIVSLLLGLLVFSAATDATTTTYSGVTTTLIGGTTTTSTYNGTNSNGIVEQGKNVTNTVNTSIPVATVTEKAGQIEKATPSKKTSGFEVVLAIMALSVLLFKLRSGIK